MIQIRNVPESLHRKLKARAAIEGTTVSDYLLTVMRHSAELPSVRELRERLSNSRPISPKVPPAEAIRQERELH